MLWMAISQQLDVSSELMRTQNTFASNQIENQYAERTISKPHFTLMNY